MTPAKTVRDLRDRALADLDGDHDYYVHMKSALQFIQKDVEAGKQFRIRNRATGNVITHDILVGKTRNYIRGQLAEATFQRFIATFESFFFDLVRLWLVAHPRSMGEKQLLLKDLLDAPNKDAAILAVAEREIMEISYRRPAEWFEYLERKAKLGCPAADEIDRFSEA